MLFPALRKLPLLGLTTLCLAGVARAQSGGGSVTASAAVSDTVALSLAEGAGTYADGVRVASGRYEGDALFITINGSTRELTRVTVRILIRSNTAYKLLASAKVDGANLAGLSVAGVRPTGALVAADAVAALTAADMFDAGGLKRPSLSAPLELLSGPRISLGGTTGSPLNALEITLSAVVEPHAGGRGWAVDLHLKSEPAAHL